MDKLGYIAQVEFRYTEETSTSTLYKISNYTIGIYKHKSEAIIEANKILEQLELRYSLNPNGDKKERFKKDSFNIISNLSYIDTPFSFYISIKPLITLDIKKTLDRLDLINAKNKIIINSFKGR